MKAMDIVKPKTSDVFENTLRCLNWAECMLLLPPRRFNCKPVGKRIEVK